MIILPMFDTAGKKVFEISFPGPWNFFYINALTHGTEAFEEAKKIEEADTLDNVEKFLYQERANYLKLLSEAFENKLELEMPDWWKNTQDPRAREGLLSHLIVQACPAWKVRFGTGLNVVGIPSDFLGDALKLNIFNNRGLVTAMFDWRTYWEPRS